MIRKTKTINCVKFSYIGTEEQFNDFLKMLIHDYLVVDHPYINAEEEVVINVESGAA